jgi:hypothetical protein
MQATFGITIKPASQLQPHEYTAAMSIFYESDTELFASTFFNSTVLIQVHPSPCMESSSNLQTRSDGCPPKATLLHLVRWQLVADTHTASLLCPT